MIPAWSPLWPECMFPIHIKKGAWVLISLIQEPMALRRLELSRNARRESVVWRLQTTAVTTCSSPWFIRSSDSISAALWCLAYVPSPCPEGFRGRGRTPIPNSGLVFEPTRGWGSVDSWKEANPKIAYQFLLPGFSRTLNLFHVKKRVLFGETNG